MYDIRQYMDGFEVYEVMDKKSNTWFRVAPERGGLVISLGIEGTELLYLDKKTFLDREANVRGGIPILFPICGQLENGAYELDGVTFRMKNHGVARTNPWQVVETNADEGSITLSLTSNEETLREFPFPFELIFKYGFKAGRFYIEQTYRNTSTKQMPMYAGFHPYFQADKKAVAYRTDATKYLDYNDMEEKRYEGELDLSGMVESVVLLNTEMRSIAFAPRENQPTIQMTYGPEFKYVVVWSVEGKPFICVEPWMAKNAAFNSGEDLVYLAPGASIHTNLQIAAIR